MRLKGYLKILTIFLMALFACLCISACKKSETTENSQETNSTMTSEEDSLDLPDTSDETFILSFEGLTSAENMMVKKGNIIGVLPKVPEKTNYKPNGWKIGEDSITASTVWNYTSNKTAKPVYVNETATYTVEHWLEDFITGEFLREDGMTENKTGFVGTEVAGVSIDDPGYEKISNHDDSREVGTVKADGSLVLKLYYSLKRYTVNLITNNDVVLEPFEVKHGTILSDMDDPVLGELDFVGWFNYGELFDIKTMPITADLTLEAEYSGTISIDTKEDFFFIKRYQSKFVNYQLDADISFVNEDFTRVETEVGTESITWDRIAYIVETLNSVFDGKGHTIQITYDKNNLFSDRKVEAYPALFHTIAANGVLRNVKIVSFTLTNFETTSVTRRNYGLIENCFIDATHVLQHETSKAVGPEPREWFPSNTAEIVENYGTVRNCLFKIFVKHMDETVFTNSYAVRHTYDGGTFENCTVIGDISKQFISTDYVNFAFLGLDPALTVANKDSVRSECYVFSSISDLTGGGNGGKYNSDGTITAGTYDSVKNYYTGAYWTAWLQVEE